MAKRSEPPRPTCAPRPASGRKLAGSDMYENVTVPPDLGFGAVAFSADAIPGETAMAPASASATRPRRVEAPNVPLRPPTVVLPFVGCPADRGPALRPSRAQLSRRVGNPDRRPRGMYLSTPAPLPRIGLILGPRYRRLISTPSKLLVSARPISGVLRSRLAHLSGPLPATAYLLVSATRSRPSWMALSRA